MAQRAAQPTAAAADGVVASGGCDVVLSISSVLPRQPKLRHDKIGHDPLVHRA